MAAAEDGNWDNSQSATVMENSSLPCDDVACNNGTTTAPLEEDDLKMNLSTERRLAFRIIYGIIGTVGVIDNLLVLVVFIFFVKIADKVGAY